MRGKGSYVADKEVDSTQVDRMDSVRCVYRRRSLPVHSDHTADHSHCSCCSVRSRNLKTDHGYSRLLMRTCKYGCWVEHNLPGQWWCHYSCTNYRDKASLKNVNGYREWKSMCICTFCIKFRQSLDISATASLGFCWCNNHSVDDTSHSDIRHHTCSCSWFRIGLGHSLMSTMTEKQKNKNEVMEQVSHAFL